MLMCEPEIVCSSAVCMCVRRYVYVYVGMYIGRTYVCMWCLVSPRMLYTYAVSLKKKPYWSRYSKAELKENSTWYPKYSFS